jgi:hypothetical protein
LIVCWIFDDCLIIDPSETEHWNPSKGGAHYFDTGWQRAGIYAPRSPAKAGNRGLRCAGESAKPAQRSATDRADAGARRDVKAPPAFAACADGRNRLQRSTLTPGKSLTKGNSICPIPGSNAIQIDAPPLTPIESRLPAPAPCGLRRSLPSWSSPASQRTAIEAPKRHQIRAPPHPVNRRGRQQRRHPYRRRRLLRHRPRPPVRRDPRNALRDGALGTI